MNKKFQIKDAGPVLRAARISGVKVTLNVMVGFPSETFLDFIHTIIFLLKNRMWIRSVSNVTSTQLALGTPIWLNPEKFGVTILPDGSWYSHDTGNETDRKRRLRFLHWAMTCLIIPHQKIAKD